jgi:hypothetical protein
MTIFVVLFLPETKGIPIEEMSIIWRKHWFWKRILPDDVDRQSQDSGTELINLDILSTAYEHAV